MLSLRAHQALQITKLCHVLSRDLQGRPKKILVPGSEGKQYEVILRRGPGVIYTECNLLLGGIGSEPCKGAINSVCVHGLAALDKSAQEAKKKIYYCEKLDDAKRLSHIGGKSFSVKSWKSGKEIWFVLQ